MSALMDSNPVLVQKLTTMGLEATYVTRLVNAGVTTMSRPSSDEVGTWIDCSWLMSAAGIIFDLLRTRLLIRFGCDLERFLSGLCRLLESFLIHLRIDSYTSLAGFLDIRR